MKRSKTDVLIFAEDAGAANYLVHLPEGLQQAGCPVVLLADGVARKFFADRGMAYVPADGLGGAAKILDRFVPRLVVTGASENPESLGLFLTDEARKKDIPSVGVVDAFMNAEYRFRGVTDNALAHVPEYLLVPDRATGHEFVRLGVPAGKVFVCGHPQYDFVREQAKRMEREGKHAFRRRFFPNAPEEAKIVIFAAEQPGGLNREDFLRSDKYTLFGRGKSQTRNEIVLEEFLDAVALMDMRPWLVLRLPPKASPENFTSFLDAFDQVSWTEPVVELIFAADGVCGMTTTLLLEAVIMGRPTFSIVPRTVERDWLPTIRANVTPCVTDRETLRAHLPVFVETLANMRSEELRDTFVFGARERVVRVLRGILKSDTTDLEDSRIKDFSQRRKEREDAKKIKKDKGRCVFARNL